MPSFLSDPCSRAVSEQPFSIAVDFGAVRVRNEGDMRSGNLRLRLAAP